MNYGVFIFPTDTAIRPDTLAREAEARGFESIWFPEHSHIPTSRETPWGGREGAPDLPEQYWRTHDQYIALALAAAATTELRLGTGVTLIAQRDPIWTAKEVATLDHLSGGRVLLGVGYGWNKEEMAQHGVAYLERRDVMREKIAVMKALWTREVSSYEGEIVSLEPSWAWPKPANQPHPPILMGAAPGPRTLADIVEYCDGWIPIAGRHDIVGQIARVREAVDSAGRDVEAFEITAHGAKLDQVDQLARAGVDRILFTLPSLGADVVLPKLDAIGKAVFS